MKSSWIIPAIVACAFYGAGHYTRDLMAQVAESRREAALKDSQLQAAATDRKSEIISGEISQSTSSSLAAAATVAEEVRKRMNDLEKDPPSCPDVPKSVIRVLDAAATGDLSYLPPASAGTAPETGTVKTLDLAASVADNYAACTSNLILHNSVLDWYEAQERLYETSELISEPEP